MSNSEIIGPRKSLRLAGYDYSRAGAYFVTFATHNMQRLFGEIRDCEVRLNEFGKIASEEWLRAGELREEVKLDEFVIMPDHIHGIIFLLHDSAAIRRSGPKPGSLGAIVGQFKSSTSKRINELRGMPGAPVWHRGYYDHVIRDRSELERFRKYITDNPRKWALGKSKK